MLDWISLMANGRYILGVFLWGLVTLSGCSYRYYAEELKPLEEHLQGERRVVADDGTVTFSQGRLDIGMRPMSVEALNRQFGAQSENGARSTNPYTFGNSTYFRTGETPQRFTVFRLKVSNYEYPKVYIDPSQIYLTTANGRKYYALTFPQLNVYHRRYARGGSSGRADGGVSGNLYQEWKERVNLLERTLFPNEHIFSAQETDGYIVFEPLAPDVAELMIHIPDVIVRFDFKGDPIETVDVDMKFEREIGRIYPDGHRELSQR